LQEAELAATWNQHIESPHSNHRHDVAERGWVLANGSRVEPAKPDSAIARDAAAAAAHSALTDAAGTFAVSSPMRLSPRRARRFHRANPAASASALTKNIADSEVLNGVWRIVLKIPSSEPRRVSMRQLESHDLQWGSLDAVGFIERTPLHWKHRNAAPHRNAAFRCPRCERGVSERTPRPRFDAAPPPTLTSVHGRTHRIADSWRRRLTSVWPTGVPRP
jgi:hypothetical protein